MARRNRHQKVKRSESVKEEEKDFHEILQRIGEKAMDGIIRERARKVREEGFIAMPGVSLPKSRNPIKFEPWGIVDQEDPEDNGSLMRNFKENNIMPEAMVTRSEFKKYVQVQKEGKFNMLDPAARIATGLSEEKFLAILKDYTWLASKYPEVISKQ